MKILDRTVNKETETITYRSKRNVKDDKGNVIDQKRVQEKRERVVEEQARLLIQDGDTKDWMDKEEAEEEYASSTIDALEKQYLLESQGFFFVNQGKKRKKVTR